MDPIVKHNADRFRYELWLEDQMVGLADYSLQPGQIHFVHTEVNPEHQGKNFAAMLMRGALDDVRASGKNKVVPVCSYVVMYMKRHPETHDLLGVDIDEAVAACRLPNVAKASEKLGLPKPE